MIEKTSNSYEKLEYEMSDFDEYSHIFQFSIRYSFLGGG